MTKRISNGRLVAILEERLQGFKGHVDLRFDTLEEAVRENKKQDEKRDERIGSLEGTRDRAIGFTKIGGIVTGGAGLIYVVLKIVELL